MVVKRLRDRARWLVEHKYDDHAPEELISMSNEIESWKRPAPVERKGDAT